MTLEKLQQEKNIAMKTNNIIAKNAFSGMIDAVQKATITSKGRIEATEQLVNETLIKYQKTIQEQIDTCPVDRVELLENYKQELAIVKMYAPQLITNKEEIANMITEIIAAAGIEPVKASRGAIMKLISAELKGKVDMKIASAIVGEVLK